MSAEEHDRPISALSAIHIMSIKHKPAHAGYGVVTIDPLRFLAGCRTRRLNQAISVLYLSMFYCVVAY